jgi:hypothetical protein
MTEKKLEGMLKQIRGVVLTGHIFLNNELERQFYLAVRAITESFIAETKLAPCCSATDEVDKYNAEVDRFNSENEKNDRAELDAMKWRLVKLEDIWEKQLFHPPFPSTYQTDIHFKGCPVSMNVTTPDKAKPGKIKTETCRGTVVK